MTYNSINNVNFNKFLNENADSSSKVESNESTPNSVVVIKSEKKKLTPEIEAYIISKGLNPDNITDVELAQCLQDYYLEQANADKNTPESNNIKPSGSGDVQVTEENSTVVATSQQSNNSAKPIESTVVSAKPVETKENKSVDLANSKKAFKSDFNDSVYDDFIITGSNVFDCDFSDELTLSKEQKENFFVESLAKFEYAKSKWDSMTVEEQDACLNRYQHNREKFIENDTLNENWMLSNILPHLAEEEWPKVSKEEQVAITEKVEAQLAENVPSWEKMQPEDKVILARSFLGAGAFTVWREDSMKSGDNLFTQIEKVIPKIIERRQKQTDSIQQYIDLDNNALAYLQETENFTGNDLSEYKNGNYTDVVRYNYLKDKIAKNNGDVSILNEAESSMYAEYKSIEDRGFDLTKLGKYSKDKSNSTFTIMKKDEVYNAAYRAYMDNMFVSVDEEGEVIRDAQKEATYAYVKKELSNLIKYKDGKLYDVATNREISKQEAAEICHNKFIEWNDNCDIFAQKRVLFDVAERLYKERPEIGDLAKVTNVSIGTQKLIAASDSNVAERQNDVLNEIVKNKDSGVQSLAGIVVKNPNVLGAMKKTDVATISLSANNDVVSEAFLTGIEEGNYTAEEQDKIGKTVYANENGEYDTKTQVYLASNTHRFDKSIRLEQVDAALNTGNVDVTDAVASNVHKHDKEEQNPIFDKVKTASEKFDKDDAIRIQTSLSDNIELLHKDNQLAAHKTIMTSSHEEVLEHATQNISNYDSSVQAEAIRTSIETGNQKAIDAAVAQANKIASDPSNPASREVASDVNIQQTINNVETRYNNILAENVANVISEMDKSANPEMDEVSISEKREQYVKAFIESDPQTQYKLLSKLPESKKKQVYMMIAKFCPSLLSGLISQGYGEAIVMTPGLDGGTRSLVLHMMEKDSKYKKVAYNIVLKKFNKSNVDSSMYKRAEEFFMSDKEKKELAMQKSTDATIPSYSTVPLADSKFMKTVLASNFNDVNYRKVYKDMPPIRG